MRFLFKIRMRKSLEAFKSTEASDQQRTTTATFGSNNSVWTSVKFNILKGSVLWPLWKFRPWCRQIGSDLPGKDRICMTGHKTSTASIDREVVEAEFPGWEVKRVVQYLGVLLDQDLCMEEYVSSLGHSCIYQIYQFKVIWQNLSCNTTVTCVHSFILMCLTVTTLSSQPCRNFEYNSVSPSSTAPLELSLTCQISQMLQALWEKSCTGFWLRTWSSSREQHR